MININVDVHDKGPFSVFGIGRRFFIRRLSIFGGVFGWLFLLVSRFCYFTLGE